MKKVFIENLPKWSFGPHKDRVNWKESVGGIVKFIYDQIQGEIKIVDYKQDNIIVIQFNEEYFSIKTDQFSRAKIGKIIGLRTGKYIYKIGDCINEKLIILQTLKYQLGNGLVVNRYEYKCLDCGNVDTILESNLQKNKGCNVCCGRKVLRGYNDMWTTNPDIAALLLDPNDGYKYAKASNKKTTFKCLNCDNILKNKKISNVFINGLSCPRCSDGVSYPEKFIYNMFSQLGIRFEYQKKFSWSNNNKRYDFYIPNLNCIVEAHGAQHYSRGFGGVVELKEIQINDTDKKIKANSNKIKYYIEVDCRRSELNYIKEKILESSLNNLLELKKIDWMKCHEYACSSLVKTTSEIWNQGIKDTKDIGELISLSRNTVSKYLKQGAQLGWCDYDPMTVQRNNGLNISKKYRSKPVVRMTLNGEFIDEYENAPSVERVLGFSRSTISVACRSKGSIISHGFKWMFKNDYEYKIS